MRTQADRDQDLALGRELERKDAEIARLQTSLTIASFVLSDAADIAENIPALRDVAQVWRMASRRAQRAFQQSSPSKEA